MPSLSDFMDEFFTLDNTFVASGFYDTSVDQGQIKSPYFTREMATQICKDRVYEKQIAGYTITDEAIEITFRNYRDDIIQTYRFVQIDGEEFIQLGYHSWPWIITNL